jgi:predicted esterase
LFAVGYSNGANIAGSLLLLRPETLAGAILLRPMVPIVPKQLPDLTGVPVLVVSGHYDPISPPDEALQLVTMLRNAGADVSISLENAGHELTEGTMEIARQWLGAVGRTEGRRDSNRSSQR